MKALVKKWLWCSWKHRTERCYPEVWAVNSNFWHCTKCQPCWVDLDSL